MMAQEAAVKELASSRPQRLLAYNKSFTCTDMRIGDTALSYKAASEEGAPRWRGPALISAIDEAGEAVKFQSQTFEVARF